MSKSKRAEPELRKPLLRFQQRYGRELATVKRQAVACKTQAEKHAQVVAESCLKVIARCDVVLGEMQQTLHGLLSQEAPQPPTNPQAKKTPPTRKAKV